MKIIKKKNTKPKPTSRISKKREISTEFIFSFTHEISQPLTAICSYAHAAKRMLATPLPEPTNGATGGREYQIQEILQHIINDNQRATEVIQRLRSLLKKNVSEMKPIDVKVAK